MVHETLTSRLLAAKDFIEVASVACHVGKHQFGVHHSVVTLQALDGQPLIVVDDIATITDEQRMAWVTGEWQLDPYQRLVREHHAPVGDETLFVLPILQPGELLGTIRCGLLQGFTPELRRDLTTLSCHVSVRLAQLGITTVPCPILAKLTPRQRDVAQLAARGQTNAEIGEALQLSENTVKKHLKDIFDLLEIGNRTELAAHLLTGPNHHVPVGVSRRGDVWITRTP